MGTRDTNKKVRVGSRGRPVRDEDVTGIASHDCITLEVFTATAWTAVTSKRQRVVLFRMHSPCLHQGLCIVNL